MSDGIGYQLDLALERLVKQADDIGLKILSIRGFTDHGISFEKECKYITRSTVNGLARERAE